MNVKILSAHDLRSGLVVDIETVKAALRQYGYAYQPAADGLATIMEQRHGAGEGRKAS